MLCARGDWRELQAGVQVQLVATIPYPSRYLRTPDRDRREVRSPRLPSAPRLRDYGPLSPTHHTTVSLSTQRNLEY